MEFLENIQVWISNNSILMKIFFSVGIIIVTAVVVRIAVYFFDRWEKRLLRRQKKHHGTSQSLKTKTMMVRRIFILGIWIAGLIAICFQFEALRSLGAGLLASAGAVGIVVGIASRDTLSNLMGGVYISFAQPAKLDDAVIFNNEWGWIEELSASHTIIKTWDNRRLVVPNTVFINSVIENWTMKDPSLLGIIILYVDYTCDIDRLRAWTEEIVKRSEHAHEDKVSVVQVVDFTEKAMKIRILAKGPDASSTWNLRCEIREKLIKKFNEEKLPLPVFRIEKEETEKKAVNREEGSHD